MTSFDACTLEGAVVVHEARGVGLVKKVVGNRVVIRMGIQNPINNERERSISYWVWDYLSEPSFAMDWAIPIDTFLDKPELKLAPNPKAFNRIEMAIKHEQSNVIIHTNNPPSPATVKNKMAKEYTNALKNSTLWYDGEFLATYRQLIEVLDWQLSYALLRGNEQLDHYLIRLDIIEDSIGVNSWREHIVRDIPQFAEITVDRAVECLAAIAGYYMYQMEMTPKEAITAAIKLAEDRMKMHLSIIQGFNRNRKRYSSLQK